MPRLFRRIKEIRGFMKDIKCGVNNVSVGFVPTMGY